MSRLDEPYSTVFPDVEPEFEHFRELASAGERSGATNVRTQLGRHSCKSDRRFFAIENAWDRAMEYWKTLNTDEGAAFDKDHGFLERLACSRDEASKCLGQWNAASCDRLEISKSH